MFFFRKNAFGAHNRMGAEFKKQAIAHRSSAHVNPTKRQLPIEVYFRPSCSAVLNNRFAESSFFTPFYGKSHKEIVIPRSLVSSPRDTVLNYFSILRDAENLKMGKMGGCGTVGMARIPFPFAYNMLTEQYRKKLSYPNYLKSFEGVGRTHLILLEQVPADKPGKDYFFIELETIEGSDKDVTYFAYYYGYVDVGKEKGVYKISSIRLFGEDFLCAAFHGWDHDALAVVEIKFGEWCKLVKKIKPVEQEGHRKTIEFSGTDGNEYRFIFFQLTNHTDILAAQYRKKPGGGWEGIHIVPEKCLQQGGGGGL
ncbi:hypothetical protein DRW41_16375 [Neobacillus piezotolerans]|uniref:Uncharacterized protein n=1 Tax=Neobacillus piezotolerans TaxID=2259171 RepID=A0A3D8GMT2_9BACI|nr:hypothetical protein [Neobacillus piezotolerans]RDU35718.1 hypothetical protein DRW41_16375 [Neobacillus piezotolerans]